MRTHEHVGWLEEKKLQHIQKREGIHPELGEGKGHLFLWVGVGGERNKMRSDIKV